VARNRGSGGANRRGGGRRGAGGASVAVFLFFTVERGARVHARGEARQ
jgi:hypothetical protein